jgi:hypothetical protein
MLAALSPWLDGLYVKQQLSNQVHTFNQFFQNQAKLSISSYHQGWLSSRATLKINVHPSIEIPVEINIAHGPFIYNKSTKRFVFALSDINANVPLPEKLQAKGNATLSSIAYFNQHWQQQFSLPAIDIQQANQGNINWQGLTGRADVTLQGSNASKLQLQVNLGALQAYSNIVTQIKALHIQPVTLSYQGALHPTGLWIGAYTLSTPGISITTATDKQLNITQLELTNRNDITIDNFYQTYLNLLVKEIAGIGLDIPTISNGKISISTLGVDAKNLAEFKQFITQHPANEQVLEKLLTITTPTSSLTIDESLSTPLGQLSMQGTLSQNPENPAKTIAELQKNLIAKMNVRVAIPLAKKLIDLNLGTPIQSKANTVSETLASIDKFNDKIAALMKTGKLPLASTIDVMTLRTQSTSIEQFKQGLTTLKLPPTTISQLIDIYQQTMPVAPPAVNQTEVLIKDWLHKGYLIQDNQDYMLAIVQENGSVTINGKPLPQH